MVDRGGYPYYDEEERPQRRQGRGPWGFVLGVLIGLVAGFGLGRGYDPSVSPVGMDWALVAAVPLVILLVVALRLRERPTRAPLPPSQARSIVLVLVGLIVAVALALGLLLTMGR